MQPVYLDSRRKGQRRSHPIKRFRFVAGGLLLVALLLVFVRLGQIQLANRVGRQFQTAWEAQDYSQAHLYFDQIVSASQAPDWKVAASVYAQWEQEGQEQIRNTREAFLRKVESETYQLEETDQKFFVAFEQENAQYLHDYMMTICNDIMIDKLTPEAGRSRLQVLRQLPGFQQETQQVEALLPYLHSFSQEYQKALSMQDVSQQVRLFRSMQTSLSDPIFDSLRQFFSTQENRAVEKWKEQNVKQLDAIWNQGRFYTVRNRVEQWLQLLPQDAEALSWQARVQAANLVPTRVDTEAIPVFVLQSVVADPKRAMQSSKRTYYMQNVLPEASVRALLQSLYDRGFVLVDPETGMDPQTGRSEGVLVPKDKKPVVLVVDGLNYLPERAETGGFQKLMLNANGERESTWVDAEGVTQNGPDREVTGIVDRFVAEHPDFAFDGARGILVLDSDEPFFGTVATARQLRNANARLAERSQPLLPPDETVWQEGAKQVRALANQLREQGWRFAWTFGDSIDFSHMSAAEWQQEIKQHQETIENLVGPVQTFAFASGTSMGSEDRRFQQLFEQGLHLFLEPGEAFVANDPSTPLRLVLKPVNALTFYFRKERQYFDSDSCYQGIIAAKMYDPPEKKKS